MLKGTPFHLAIPVNDLEAARQFYAGLLACKTGRSSDRWTDYDFFGHQLVCHLDTDHQPQPAHNPVDGHDIPVPHFGIVMDMPTWQALADRLQAANVEFVVEPYIRFAGQPGEQATMFLLDPSGNALEFKAFRDIEKQLFET